MKKPKKTCYSASRSTLILSLLFIVVFTSGCTRFYYQPNGVNAPMLSGKNDVNFSVSANSGRGGSDGSQTRDFVFNVQAAYSPADYFGLIAGHTGYTYDVMGNPDLEAGHVNAVSSLTELGAGGYYPVRRFWNDEAALIVDTYAGFGAGYMKRDVYMDMNRLFVQPGFNVRTPYFDIGIHWRISGVRFSNLDSRNYTEEYLEAQRLLGIEDKRHYFMEPAFTVRGGYRFVKIQLQHVWSWPTVPVGWNYNIAHSSVGLFFSIDELIRFNRKNQ